MSTTPKEPRIKEYDWEAWFSKSLFRLKKGRDYKCQTHSMIAQIRRAAADFRKSVAIQAEDDLIVVQVK